MYDVMRVEAIKIGKYDPTIEGRVSKYEGYCLSTEEKHDPPLTYDAYKDFVDRSPYSGPILSSTLRRGMQTADILPKIPGTTVIPLAALREIPFSLLEMVTREEFEDREGGSRLVRIRFVEKFVENKLLQSRAQIEDNLEQLLSTLSKVEGENVVIISHSFFLKVLEAYVTGFDIFKNPEVLAQFISPNTKTFPFGGVLFL
jgi:broad specificity phosphatase PhoE